MKDLKNKLDKRWRKNKQQRRKDLFLSVITLNLNGLNFPIKRQRSGEWKKETLSYYMLCTTDSLQIQGHKEVQSER